MANRGYVEVRTDEQTSADIVSALRARGEHVTAEQLERWRQARLIPSARQIIRGGRDGTTWLHPPGTLEQVLALVRLRPRKIGLAEATVRLWMARFELEEVVVRRALARVMEHHERGRAELASVDVAEKFGDGLARSRSRRQWWSVSTPFEQMEVVLGVEAVMRALAENRPLSRDEGVALGRIFAPKSAERAALASLTSNFPAELTTAFDLMRFVSRIVQEASWDDLTRARMAAEQFRTLVAAIAAAPPDATRDLILRHLERMTPPTSELLVAMLMLRTHLIRSGAPGTTGDVSAEAAERFERLNAQERAIS